MESLGFSIYKLVSSVSRDGLTFLLPIVGNEFFLLYNCFGKYLQYYVKILTIFSPRSLGEISQFSIIKNDVNRRLEMHGLLV